MTATTTLRGSLDDLSIDGVIRLLATTRTSGVLTVSPNAPVRLVWSDGRILTGSAGSAMALGRYVLAAGLVGAEQMEELFGLVRTRLGDRQARSFGEIDVLEALAPVVPPDELRRVSRAHAIAALTDAAQLPSAFWHVDATDAHPLGDTIGSVADEVLAEAVDQLRDWPDIQATVGGDEARYRRVLRLSVGVGPVLLHPIEWSALAEMDTHATVAQIAHRLGIGRYDSYVLADELSRRGLAERAL